MLLITKSTTHKFLQMWPANMAFNTLISDLDKIANLEIGPSALSLGTGTGSDQRIALYEIPNNNVLTAGHYFYGLGLVELGSYSLGTGIGLWGGTASALPRQNTANGLLPHMLISISGNVGINNANPSEKLHVTGNILCSGTISGSSKSFDIQHPDPNKNDMRLRHWCVESDVPGGMVIYRRQIVTTNAQTITLTMPDWFKHLTTNVIIFVAPMNILVWLGVNL